MDDYIGREAALEEFDWYANEFCECEYAIMPLKGALEDLPSADVRPVKRGKWELKRYGPWASRLKCSECGTLFDIATDSAAWNFCPNCGADMRGGEADG